MPLNPPPITATRFDFGGKARTPSPASPNFTHAFSSLTISIAPPASFLLHSPWQGWSQMWLMMPGKGTVFWSSFKPPLKSFCWIAAIIPRTSTWMGQAAMQAGACSWMQRLSVWRSSSWFIMPSYSFRIYSTIDLIVRFWIFSLVPRSLFY